MAHEKIPEVEIPQHENQEAESTESIELDLKEFGNMPVAIGGGKPIFEKVTPAIIENATMMTTKEKKVAKSKDGTEQEYYPVFLKLTYNVDGQKVFENLGGAKMYLNKLGKPTKFLIGKDSALGKLKALIEDNFDFKGAVKEISVIAIGKKVGIKTISSEVGGETYQKNLVQVFYK